MNLSQKLKQFFHGIMKLSFLILFVYIWIITILYASKNNLSLTVPFLIIMAFFSLLLTFLILFTLKKLPNLRPEGTFRKVCRKSLLIFFCVFLAFFSFYMVYFAGQFPGGVNADIHDQLAQALGETAYNDWHPVLHTLLFMTIPLQFINRYSFIIFLQLLYLCLAFTYLLFVLYQNGGSKFFLGGAMPVYSDQSFSIHLFRVCYERHRHDDLCHCAHCLLYSNHLFQGHMAPQKKEISSFFLQQ